ncbi:hypothetical protein PR002_g902 [Phytophthora rubi]|uniref:Uncharacterized protein n=1 Tax=Phytophthora rubi TaxID=129364 RepID=A0A6A3P3P9_9STRA|nr:hypothetical protein PR002_g902 [Phytophthora rubi]
MRSSVSAKVWTPINCCACCSLVRFCLTCSGVNDRMLSDTKRFRMMSPHCRSSSWQPR